MQRVEGLRACVRQDGHQIDNHIGAGNRARDGIGISQVGLDRVDLPDRAHGLQMARKIRPADRGAHAIAALCQGRDRMAPNKPRAPKHDREFAVSCADTCPNTRHVSCPALPSWPQAVPAGAAHVKSGGTTPCIIPKVRN